MRKLNEKYWDQLSMWDFAPIDCIEKYATLGNHTFHYVLKEVVELTSNNSYRTKYVTDISTVSGELFVGVARYFVRINDIRNEILTNKI